MRNSTIDSLEFLSLFRPRHLFREGNKTNKKLVFIAHINNAIVCPNNCVLQKKRQLIFSNNCVPKPIKLKVGCALLKLDSTFLTCT